MIDGWGISCEIALIWMSLDFTDNQSTLVQVMARCRKATSHYLSQCWPRSLSPYGVTRPQWVEMHSLSFGLVMVSVQFIVSMIASLADSNLQQDVRLHKDDIYVYIYMISCNHPHIIICKWGKLKCQEILQGLIISIWKMSSDEDKNKVYSKSLNMLNNWQKTQNTYTTW